MHARLFCNPSRKYWLCAFIFVLFLSLLTVGCGSGTTGNGSGAKWHYTAMGDSLAAGALAEMGYVPRYATYLNTDTSATITTLNLGIPGWTSGDLLNALQNDPAFRKQVSDADVVTWDIGGNDLSGPHDSYVNNTCGGPDNQDCLRSAVATFETNWDAIVVEILKLRDPNKTILRTMDIYNPYVAADMQAGRFTTIEPYLDQANNHIADSGKANNIPVAAVHTAFNGADGMTGPR